MRGRPGLLVAVFALAAARMFAQREVTGVVVRVQGARREVVVSCDEVPGVMSAMEMDFRVRDGGALRAIHAGIPVRFTMVEHGRVLYAEGLRETIGANLEPEPMDAGALSTLQGALTAEPKVWEIAVGQRVPDFELTDQVGKRVRLAELRGKVVLLTFGYSRCPNPDYCLRLSNNLAGVRDRFGARGRRDLVLITVAIDPEYDQGAALARYAEAWKADPEEWHFLTGPMPEVKRVAARFGMNFWRSEGLLTHTLHTVVIDRSGALAANLEGNGFTVRQLGDLVEGVMDGAR